MRVVRSIQVKGRPFSSGIQPYTTVGLDQLSTTKQYVYFFARYLAKIVQNTLYTMSLKHDFIQPMQFTAKR